MKDASEHNSELWSRSNHTHSHTFSHIPRYCYHPNTEFLIETAYTMFRSKQRTKWNRCKVLLLKPKLTKNTFILKTGVLGLEVMILPKASFKTLILAEGSQRCDLRACLSCFRNGNEKADLEGSPQGLQTTWIVKIILGQFSLIRDSRGCRNSKLHFCSRLGSPTPVFSCHFWEFQFFFTIFPLLKRIGIIVFDQQAANQPLITRRSGPTCHKMSMPIIITILLALSNSSSYQAT